MSFHLTHSLKKIFLVILCSFGLSSFLFAQKYKADSVANILATESSDKGRVEQMWTMAKFMLNYNPDSAQLLSQKALYLAKAIADVEGQSRSLGILANSLMKIGNYPQALKLDFEKLQIEEKRNNPRSLTSVLMNIGIVYVLQGEYRQALDYYYKSDSVSKKYNVKDFKWNTALNMGDAYNKLDISDSALVYFNNSLNLARDSGDIGKSLTGLGHSFQKLGSYDQSMKNYHQAIVDLKVANDDETFCEATLGLANLYEKLHKQDSAEHFATLSLNTARNGGFLPAELEAAEFLTKHYQMSRKIDSAFAYVNYVRDLNDSVNSIGRIRESQIISSNEKLRQTELEEEKLTAQRKRMQQLQLLLIGLFIPTFFLLTLFLSRIRVHTKAVRLLGVLSLLFLFEYLTLLLHPTIAALTNHTPIFEIIIFVGIAAVLIPLHHRLEHWMIHKLGHLSLHHKHVEKKSPATDVTGA
jgi:tetratricopeptide (TPR) repeat protein